MIDGPVMIPPQKVRHTRMVLVLTPGKLYGWIYIIILIILGEEKTSTSGIQVAIKTLNRVRKIPDWHVSAV